MAFMHFNKSIDILNSIDIENLKVRKRYLNDTLRNNVFNLKE